VDSTTCVEMLRTPVQRTVSNDQILWMSLGEAAQVGAPSRG
jgi:hypothetical protein